MKKLSQRAALLGILGLLVLVIVGILALSSRKDAQVSSTNLDDVPTLVKTIAKHLSVNVAEPPSVAVVEQPDVLRSQNDIFYREVEAGDRLLVWSDKIVLYSVRRDVVLSILPVVNASSVAAGVMVIAPPVQQPAQNVVSVPGIRASFTVEVRNGSGIKGKASDVTKILENAGFKVLSPGNMNGEYEKTTFVVGDPTKDMQSALKDLATVIKGQAGPLPDEEDATKADILVILGKS